MAASFPGTPVTASLPALLAPTTPGGSLVAETDVELAAIQAQADPDVDETVSGDAIGSSVICRVQLGEIEYIRERDEWYFSVPFTIREV